MVFLNGLAPEVIKFPSPQKQLDIKTHYSNKLGFPNVVECIDGCHIKIDKPGEREVDYINRKSYHSINMQGVCDHNLKFTDVCIGYPGSVHDARIFANSPLNHYINDRIIDGYLLGDSAYPLSAKLIVPFRDNGHLNNAQRYLNRKHSQCRISIEHTFGLLKQRFRQLYHLKLRGLERICKFVNSCCVLHNLGSMDDLSVFQNEPHQNDDQPLQEEYPGPRNQGYERREEICSYMYLNK